MCWPIAWSRGPSISPRSRATTSFADGCCASYTRQAHHLNRVAGRAAPGLPRLAALRGLVIAWAALGHAARQNRALERFLKEVDAQILPDGGHVERSGRPQFIAMRYLIEVRDALQAAEIEVPNELQSAIDRAAPMLRFFRHGDNRFALFNGTNEDDAARHRAGAEPRRR